MADDVKPAGPRDGEEAMAAHLAEVAAAAAVSAATAGGKPVPADGKPKPKG